MTVPVQEPIAKHLANGITTVFPLEFLCLQERDLIVTVGGEVVDPIGYTVTGLGTASGAVTFNSPPTDGVEVIIYMEVVLARDTNYQYSGDFLTPVVNPDFDRLWLALQSSMVRALRALQLGVGDTDGSGSYRAKHNRIINLGYPESDTDAATQGSAREIAEQLTAGVVGGYGAFQQDGTGAIVRTFQNKQREWVSVEDFIQPGDVDDTPAFIRACSLGCVVVAAGSAYTLTGEIPLASGTHLQFTRDPLITFDLSGENGRGFWFGPGVANASVTGAARIDATVTTAGSDGTRNGVFTMASNFYVLSDPDPISNCTIAGRFNVRMLGPANGKAVQLYGYVEDVLVQGVHASGQTNFAFAAHWIGNGASSVIPTKTWHPNRIVFRDCQAKHDGADGSLLRAFTVSAGGHIVFDNCHAQDAQTLGFNLFVGDFGFTYAQNVGEADAFDIALNDCSYSGTSVALSVDGVSSRLYGSPLWAGPVHKAALKIDGFLARMKSGTSGLDVAIAGLQSLSARALRVIEEADGNTSQAMYLTSIANVDVQGEVVSRGGVLVRDCGNVDNKLAGTRVVEAHDVSGYVLASSAVSEILTTTAETAAGGTAVALSSATIVAGPGGMLRYDDGSTVHEMELRSMTYSGGAQTISITPAPVTIPSGATVTLIQTVRRLQIGAVRLAGARFLLSLTGSATAKPRNVSGVGTTFRRAGLADVNAAAVDGLLLTGCSFDQGGNTTTTTSTSSVLLGAQAEGFAVTGNRFGKANARVRYLVQCDNASQNGSIGGNLFESVNAGATNPAAIFKDTAANVVIGDNVIGAGITPIYPIPA